MAPAFSCTVLFVPLILLGVTRALASPSSGGTYAPAPAFAPVPAMTPRGASPPGLVAMAATKRGGAAAARQQQTGTTTVVLKNYRPLPPAHEQPIDVRCALLHLSARKAIKSGKTEIARRFYTLFVYNWPCKQTDACLAHTYFLWALLEQHTNDVPRAREVYKEAVGRFPTHARLLQAWALMESKNGQLDEARSLIQEAVKNDRSLAPVLKWKLWGLQTA